MVLKCHVRQLSCLYCWRFFHFNLSLIERQMSESLIIVLAETAGLTGSSAFFMKYSHQHFFLRT